MYDLILGLEDAEWIFRIIVGCLCYLDLDINKFEGIINNIEIVEYFKFIYLSRNVVWSVVSS